MNQTIFHPRRRAPFIGALGAAALLLAGCQGSEDSNNVEALGVNANYPPATAQSLAMESADSYDDNEYGLITGSTLMRWIDDWAVNKPGHISGDLIILQVSDGSLTSAVDSSCMDSDGDGTGVCKYFKPAPGVRSYSLDSSTWVETRSNGVAETISVVLSGPKMDALLAAYDIDPRNDMIVFAMGHGGAFQNMLMGRAHYLFRYWGTDNSHLAMLNGGATHAGVIPAGMRGHYLGERNSGEAPTGGTVSVRDLYVDNTVLQATLGDMMAVARGEVPDAMVWDARSPGEWSGELYSTSGTSSDCIDVNDVDEDGDSTDTTRCVTALNGTVRGAVNLNYIELLITDDGGEDLSGNGNPDPSYRYLDKATLATMVAGLGYTQGQTLYTYCRTTYRAMITGTVSGLILGYPTRFYDGAMIEWLQMANYNNSTGSPNLPATSPWQTTALTGNLTFNDSSYVQPPTITDAYAANTNAVIDADRAYKAGTPATTTGGDSTGGGAALPPNPCGGG